MASAFAIDVSLGKSSRVSRDASFMATSMHQHQTLPTSRNIPVLQHVVGLATAGPVVQVGSV